MIRLAIADDHRLFLDGIAQGLEALPDLTVSGTADDGAGLLDLVERTQIDVLLVDLEMPGLDGVRALERMGSSPPAIVVTMHATPDQRKRAEEAGAAGFLSKSTPLPDLAAAVRAVAAGESLMAAEDLSSLLSHYRQPSLDPGAAALTPRERELLGLLAQGVSSTDELADLMFISQKTVKNHLASIYEKLAVSDRTQAAVEAIRLGLLPPNPARNGAEEA